MKTLAAATVGMALLGAVVLSPVATDAQNAAAPSIPGYLDPTTGVFSAQAAFPAAGSGIAVTGSITVTTNVSIDAALQKIPDQTILCSVTVGSSDAVSSNSAGGSSNVIRAGSRGTCTTTISFIWELASTTKHMSLDVSISTGNFGTGQVTHQASTFTSIPITTKKATVNLAL